MSDKMESLLDEWVDGSLNDMQETQLLVLLKDQPDQMRRFVEANVRDQLLRDVARTALIAEEVLQKSQASHHQNRFIIRIAASVAAVAATIVLALIVLAPDRQDGVKAEVVGMSNAKVSGVTAAPVVGEYLALNRFRLESGSLEVALASGVRVEFVAPAEAQFESNVRLRLLEGRISTDVGEHGKGFTVVTDAGEVVDLGTRFGVEADRAGESRVAVFSGSVEFHPRQSATPSKIITLTEGEALQFSARAGLRRWQQVALEADRAGLTGVPNDGIVREVRDNLGEGDLRPFYGVVRGGMKAGVLAFNDKPNPVWTAMPGEKFPAWLEGADLVRTYYHFRNIKDYELSLTLSKPADVFVLVIPGEPPGWLRDRFTPTAKQLRAGPWHPAIASHPAAVVEPEGAFLTFDIWKCEAGPGELRLGPPRENRVRGVQSLMYGLAVKAKLSP